MSPCPCPQLERLDKSADSIAGCSRQALSSSQYTGVPPRLVRLVLSRMSQVPDAAKRLSLFYVVDSMTQNATRELKKEGVEKAKVAGLKALIAVCCGLPRLSLVSLSTAKPSASALLPIATANTPPFSPHASLHHSRGCSARRLWR